MLDSLIFRIYNLCRQHLADAAHLTADVRLGDLRIAPRHVRIRMAQNLGDNVDRHSVFNRQCGKRMARQVRGQMLVNLANIRNLLQAGVHIRIRHRHGTSPAGPPPAEAPERGSSPQSSPAVYGSTVVPPRPL